MKIILSPVASSRTTKVRVSGLVVTIDGTGYDLSVIPEGGKAEAVEGSPFIGVVTRGAVTVRYEYESEKAASDQSADWANYTFELSDGEVPCPIIWKQEQAE